MFSSHHLPALGLVALLAGNAFCSPFRSSGITLNQRAEQLALNNDFPDPSIEQVRVLQILEQFQDQQYS